MKSQGKRVVHVKNDSLGQLHIYYDGNRPDMVLYNGATYRYVHSLQGDILGLQDGTGSFVVEYRYDPWGRQISKTGSLANSLGTLNPFRYRGYVYDEETSLYYLRSRYYNPIWCRFISSDSILGQVGGPLQHNIFAYCYNAPVVHFDDDGEWGKWISALATVVTAVVVAAAVVAASPVIATAAGTTAICLGVAFWATTASTIAMVGCATVATATIACGVNRGVETITEKNYGVILMGPNAYGFFETATYMSGAAICMAPNYMPYPSTGRTVPKDLQEQMKYRYAIQDGTKGKVIIPYLNDSRMPGWMGWQKYSVHERGESVDIHYVGHRFLPVRFDYKIK